MATGLREGKLWIQIRPGAGWATQSYFCPRPVALLRLNKVAGTVNKRQNSNVIIFRHDRYTNCRHKQTSSQ